MRSLRLASVQALVVVLFSVTALWGQTAVPAVRIVDPIDESQLVTLGGTVHPLANAKNDRGAAPDSTPLSRIHLLLKRSASQQATLDQLIGQLHTPGNPSYHKWLTPDEFGKQFGPSDQDIATVETWLTSHGFNVAGVKPGKQVIEFSGNVGQLRSAFHTQIHQYSVNGESHFSNANNPEIPAALAPVIAGFVSLNNFHFKSHIKELGKALYDTKTGQASPEWTIGPGSPAYQDNFVLAPQDYYVQYDLSPLYSASTPINGKGQTIAIINNSNINVGLVNQFRTLFGLPANPPQVIIDGNDPGVNGDAVEAYLDVEWAGAIAPAATVDLVIGASTELEDGLALAAEHAVYGNVAPVMSISFGECEQFLGSSNSFWSGLWEQAAAQGSTVMVSTGDSGSAGCDNPDAQEFAIYGQNVNGFASTPYNVAVGGTDFYYSDYVSGATALDNQLATYWNVTPSNNTPSLSIKAANAPIPEQPWNNSQFGLDIFTDYSTSNPATTIGGGSGGASTCATGTGATQNGWTTCTAGYPKPSWQVATGVPADKVRDIPDVSLFAANGFNDSYYPICAEDGDCQPVTSGNTVQIYGVGGTSASSPSFAGMMALVNQKYGPQGQANFVLYPMAKQYPKAFHDVTVGSNTVPCDLSGSTPDCITAPSGLGYTISDSYLGITATEGEIGTGSTAEYKATTGYDLASGLGTIDANQLVTNWGNVKLNTTTTTLTVTPPNGVSLSSIPHGTSLTFSGSVTGTGTPSGDVALVTNSTEPVNQGETFFTLSNGSYSSPVNYMPGGSYEVWTQYGGDSTDALSSSTPVKITVTPENSALTLNVLNTSTGGTIASGSSITYGTPITLDGQPAPTACGSCSSGYSYPTGTVTFFDGKPALNTAVLNAEGDAEYSAPNGLSAGSHSITATYSGDNSYNGSTASAVSITVTQAPTSVAITDPSGGVYSAGIADTLSIAVESNSSGVAPSGKVTISGAPSGTPTSATLVAGVDPFTGTTVGQTTVVIPSTAGTGTYGITVTYVPDTASAVNYTASSSTYQLQITGATGIATSITAQASPSSTSPNSLVTVTGTVTGASGGPPAGTVLFEFAAFYNGTFEDVYFTSQVATLVAGSGNTSNYSMTFDSSSVPQGINQITAQYDPSSTSSDYASTTVVTISNPLSDFSLISNTTIIPVTSGSSGTTNINVASVNTFAGTVGLTCTVPAGWTCTIPSSESVSSGGFAVAALNVTAPKTATVGSYNVLITGKDSTGEYVHTLGLNAQVTSTAPGFALSNSGNVSVLPGATTGNTSTISVTPSNGFTGGVNLTCALTNPPAGNVDPTCSVTKSVTVSGTTAVTGTLTIGTTSSTTPGTYSVTVTGTDASTGTITSSTSVGLTVKTPPSFALSNSGAISFQAGAATGNTATITVTPAGGYTGTVGFTCAITPAAASSPATCALVPVTVTGTSAVTATMTVTSTTGTTVGSYTANITGTDTVTSSLTANTSLGVTVTAPPAPAITLTNSGAISFVAGATTGNTAIITVTPSNAFTGVVDLSCAVTTKPSNPTSPATCTVTPTVDITGTSALNGTLTVTTTSTTTTGAYGITVTGKDAATGKVTATTTVDATVTAPPSIALTNSGAISLQAGATTGNTATITVTPGGSFTGNVNLSCAVTTALTSPTSPATCSVTSPVDISGTTAGTATLTITTAYATSVGAYTATVTGKDASTGKISGSTAVAITVTAPPPPAIALTNSGSLTFAAGATTGDSGTITVTPSFGFTGLVNLTCAVTPAAASSPATCSAGAVTISGTGAQTSTVTVSTTGATTPGSYTATVTGKDALTGKVTGSTAVSVTVEGFTLSNSGAITFGAGLTAGNTATITVTPASGFAASVGMTCAVSTAISSPTDAPTCSLASNSVAGASGTDVVTLASKADTTPGAYTVTVTGTSGAITETSMVAVTVNASYSATAGTVTPSSVTPGGSATSTITVTSGDGYAGSVTVSCSLTSSPTGAAYLPTCAGPSAPITLSSSTTSGTGTVTVSTTAATTSELLRPKVGPGRGWLGAGSGAVLALMLFFGIPARRRSWRSMLGVLVLMVVLGTMAGCGGGGGGGGGGTAGTTAGSYTFTVTATGSPAQSTGNTTTFKVTVN